MNSQNFKEKKIPNKLLIIPIILLGLNFIYKLIDQSKLIFTFPLDYTNDISSYMAQLFFLAKCGFHKFCPYWYNGIITFKVAPPAWFFFTLPIYWLTNNITLSTYISMILIFILIFLVIYYFGKLNRFSNTKIIAFFLFLFANAIAIGNFIRLGRLHELLAWFAFIIVAFMALWYKNKKITPKFYLITIPLSLATLAHQVVGVLAFIAMFSLFLSKRRFKNKLKIVFAVLSSLIITSFWWIPFLFEFKKTRVSLYLASRALLDFSKEVIFQNILTFLIPLIFVIIFYFYWNSKYKSKKELLFFMPILTISFLLFSRLIYFVPILKHIYPDTYIIMLLFFSIFLFFKMDINKIPGYIKKLIPAVLILVIIISLCFSIFYTPTFRTYTSLEKNTIHLLNKVDGKFLILESPSVKTSYPMAYYSYAPIYLNLTTSSGWYEEYVSDEDFKKIHEDTITLLKNQDCIELNKLLNYLNTTNIITYNEHCSSLENCNFRQIATKDNVCLFKI